MRERPYVPDQWGQLSHKQSMGVGSHPQRPEAPNWSGYHARRLTAYVILQAYLDNNSRHFLPARATITETQELRLDNEKREEHREYGDAELIRNQIRAALLGDGQDIVVEGAAQFNPDLEELDPSAEGEPVTGPNGEPLVGPDGTPLRSEPVGPSPEEIAANEESRVAAEREDWLREWADQEQFFSQMVECEDSAVGLGDGVYVLSWSERKKRVRLDVYDPDAYFPVLTDAPSGDFPRRVHVAWEVLTEEDSDTILAEGDDGRGENTKRQVRRITWELGPIRRDAQTDRLVDDADFVVHRDPEGRIVPGPGGEGEELIGRWYPWQLDESGNPAEGEEPSTETCYMTDARWDLTGLRAPSPDMFSDANVIIEKNEDGVPLDKLDLRIDFIPVVHMPNTPARRHHFGRSSLSPILQLLDDLQTTDSDLSAAAATTGSPPIWTSGPPPLDERSAGPTAQVRTYGPGEWFDLGTEGAMDMLDTSHGLDALLSYLAALLDRLSVNVRLPAAILGRLKPSEVPSGVALLLSFSPMANMIGELRLPRNEKYPLMLKFQQRISQVGSAGRDGIGLPAGPVPAAWVTFGTFLPADKADVVAQVTKLLASPAAISRQTAVQLLIDAGYDIEDAAEEVRRIEQEDFAGAVQLLDATGNEAAVSDYLGVAAMRPAAPPPPPNQLGAPPVPNPANTPPSALPGGPGGPAAPPAAQQQ